MNRLMVFPYEGSNNAFVRERMSLLFDEVIPVSPKAFGFDGKDANACDGGIETGIKINTDVHEAIDAANAVILCHSEKVKLQRYKEIIEMTQRKKKMLYLSSGLKGAIKIGDGEAKLLEFSKYHEDLTKYSALLEVAAPIISISGVGENCNKFLLQIELVRYFQNKGYKVLGLGTKEYSSVFGLTPLPGFLFQNISLDLKVKWFNQFLYEQAKQKKPELIIIGIPGGIMRMNPFRYDGCGEIALVIGNATNVDLNIASVHFSEYNQEFFVRLKDIYERKFNLKTEYFHVSNNMYRLIPEDKAGTYLNLSIDEIEPYIEKMQVEGTNVFSVYKTKQVEDVAASVLHKLVGSI